MPEAHSTMDKARVQNLDTRKVTVGHHLIFRWNCMDKNWWFRLLLTTWVQIACLKFWPKKLSFFQVVDFLSGKAPLNLTMRLGDHMMLIQLQLSTVNSASSSKRARTSATTSASASASTSASASRSAASSSTNYPLPSTSTSEEPSASGSTSASSQYRPKLDTRALTEASKNLTQTLKQLSSEVLTTRTDEVRLIGES